MKTGVRPFLELPDLQTFFCPFSVLRIFRFLALPEIAHFRFEISGNRFSARARAENLVPKMFYFETRHISRTPQKDHAMLVRALTALLGLARGQTYIQSSSAACL